MPLKVLIVASEIAPFRKTGGLADVAGALPKALKARGIDVRLVMPLYQGIKWADLEKLDGNLTVTGRSPYVAWPLGGMLGLAVVYLLGLSAREVRRREDDPTWLPAPGNRPA